MARFWFAKSVGGDQLHTTKPTTSLMCDLWIYSKLQSSVLQSMVSRHQQQISDATFLYTLRGSQRVRKIYRISTLSLLTFGTVIGACDAIDFRGIDDIRLLDKWSEGPKTFLRRSDSPTLPKHVHVNRASPGIRKHPKKHRVRMQ